MGIRVRYRHPRHYQAHMHRMLAIPATPVVFSLIGVPLAIFGFVRSRARGLLLALFLMGAYYGLFVFIYDSVRTGLFRALPAIWVPNAVVFAIAGVLLFAAVRSRR
jgi:lipopolysaccharide export LptBFGC system permease protein LptF